VDLQAAEDAGLLWPKLEGYVLIPWADAMGHPLTLYGRWSTKTPPEGRPKTLALPGEGTKSSPLYFDRARRAGHRDLVAVEGVFDAALLQARGDSRVVAYVAAQFSGGQVETMTRHRVRSVVVCPDPDGGGDRGAHSSVDALTKAGIDARVTPRLPDGLDPDEFLLRDGLEGWKAHVQAAVSGTVYQARVAIGNVTPDSPEVDRRQAVYATLSLVGSLRGPRAGLDREDVLRLTAEATGYTYEALEERRKRRSGRWTRLSGRHRPDERRELTLSRWPGRLRTDWLAFTPLWKSRRRGSPWTGSKERAGSFPWASPPGGVRWTVWTFASTLGSLPSWPPGRVTGRPPPS